MKRPIAIIAGEPNSISSEIIFKSWQLRKKYRHKPFLVIGSIHLLNLQKKKLKYQIKIKKINNNFVSSEINDSELPVYDVKYIQKKSFQKSSFATLQYNKTFDNKYLKIYDEDIEDSKNLIEYFYSLPAEIKKEIRVKNPKHLSEIYNAMVTSYGFKQNPKKGYEFALKGLGEIEKYSLGTNRNKDLYGAYHMTIL